MLTTYGAATRVQVGPRLMHVWPWAPPPKPHSTTQTFSMLGAFERSQTENV